MKKMSKWRHLPLFAKCTEKHPQEGQRSGGVQNLGVRDSHVEAGKQKTQETQLKGQVSLNHYSGHFYVVDLPLELRHSQ